MARRLRQVAAGLPAGDGLAVCCEVFLASWEAARESAGEGRSGFATVLEVVATKLALRLLSVAEGQAAGPRMSACWRPLSQFRHHPGVAAAQFALAGLNAHLGHDLPRSLVQARRSHHGELDGVEADFHRLHALFTHLEATAHDVVDHDGTLTVDDPLAHLLGAWNAERAWQDAWSSTRTLWELRELPELAEEFARQLDSRVGLTGRLLLTPQPCRR